MNVLKGILKFNKFAYPLLVVVFLLLFGIEAFRYAGFVSNHLKINIYDLLMVLFISGTLIIFTPKTTGDFKLEGNVYKICIFLAPVLLISTLVFNALDYGIYYNLAYSKFHLEIKTLPYLFSVAVLGILPIYLRAISIKFKSFSATLILAVLIFNLFYFLPNMADLIIGEAGRDLGQIKLSYTQKEERSWGFIYNYLEFVKNNTPEDAIIEVPPQESPWLTYGNVGFDRYALYPRRLINDYSSDKLKYKGADYVMLVQGDWADPSTFGWPKVKMEAKEILYLNPKTFQVSKVEGSFDPMDPKNKGAWGLIKVK